MESRPYFVRLEVIELTQSLLKARLYILPNLFVQVYRNDRFETVNLVLLHNGKRLYGRDQLGRAWIGINCQTPDEHDKSEEGVRPVSLFEFLDEVEVALAELDLP